MNFIITIFADFEGKDSLTIIFRHHILISYRVGFAKPTALLVIYCIFSLLYVICWFKDLINCIVTVNVVIFAEGKFRENVDKTFYMEVIFPMLSIILS